MISHLEPNPRRRLRLRLTSILGVFAMLTMTAGLLATTASSSSALPGQPHKAFVCKYVGKPLLGEAASHVISVSTSALDGAWFKDGQSFSHVLKIDRGGEATPSLGECPAYAPPVIVLNLPTAPVPSAADCDTPGSLRVLAVDHTTVWVNGAEVVTPRTFGPGTYNVVYRAAEGYAFADGDSVSFSGIKVAEATGDCPVDPIVLPAPVVPVPSAADCDTPGSLTVLAVDHTTVWVNGAEVVTPRTFGPGTYNVVYRAAEGYAFADGDSVSFSGIKVAEATGDCPANPPFDACPDLLGNQPSGFDCAKAPQLTVVNSAGAPNCETKLVELIETTTTTPFKFENGAWVVDAGNAVSTRTSKGFRAATALECPSVVVVTPPGQGGVVVPPATGGPNPGHGGGNIPGNSPGTVIPSTSSNYPGTVVVSAPETVAVPTVVAAGLGAEAATASSSATTRSMSLFGGGLVFLIAGLLLSRRRVS